MTTHSPATLLWFRQDLRLEDNPALQAALSRGAPIVPVYLQDDESEGRWASRRSIALVAPSFAG